MRTRVSRRRVVPRTIEPVRCDTVTGRDHELRIPHPTEQGRAGVTAYALVHGAWHGAWCWERLAAELEGCGHRVVAVDLPSDDATATFETYAEVVVRALEADGAEEVVVVGHSLAGLTIPLVAARRPVSRLVYLCALIPIPGRSFAEQMQIEPDTLLREFHAGMSEPDDQGRTRWEDRGVARSVLYADCDERDASAAFERLRPQAQTPYAEPCPIEGFPLTPCTYIVCGEDRIVNPDRSRTIARGRLDAEHVELPGSHSPFLSRPDELAAVLHERAEVTT
jgi:pimeloyl-ACP methyl ester carboxylesterase